MRSPEAIHRTLEAKRRASSALAYTALAASAFIITASILGVLP
jgi:hypothetical protein